MKTLLRLLPLVALCASSALHAPTVTPLTTIADTYVNQGSAGTSYGTAATISVRGVGGSDNNRYSYLQYDLSAIDEPITSASLTLTVAFGTDNRTASTLQLYGLVYDTAEDALALGLEENTFTNNTAPWAAVRPTNFAAPENATGLLGIANVPASGSFAGGTAFTFASTSDLVSFLESARTGPNSIVTLVIIENQGQANQLAFASREHETHAGPTLTITSGGVIPEPSTAAALCGLATLAFAAARRSRASR